jgi:hypothetical protein
MIYNEKITLDKLNVNGARDEHYPAMDDGQCQYPHIGSAEELFRTSWRIPSTHIGHNNHEFFQRRETKATESFEELAHLLSWS